MISTVGSAALDVVGYAPNEVANANKSIIDTMGFIVVPSVFVLEIAFKPLMEGIETNLKTIGIDTPEDLEKARTFLKKN